MFSTQRSEMQPPFKLVSRVTSRNNQLSLIVTSKDRHAVRRHLEENNLAVYNVHQLRPRVHGDLLVAPESDVLVRVVICKECGPREAVRSFEHDPPIVRVDAPLRVAHQK